ncbi:hypothetical protein OEZ81_26590, partial [Leclercia adecarboxylata]|uniref:hypothetical protein n=1 Tax=Leclercia adecarboxylata TaxID=83655 RepID=UPI00234CFD76
QLHFCHITIPVRPVSGLLCGTAFGPPDGRSMAWCRMTATTAIEYSLRILPCKRFHVALSDSRP